MKPFTRLALLIYIISFLNLNTKAQDDANAGIYIDGTFADKIDCWTFDQMNLIFPIRESWKKYDKLYIHFFVSRASLDYYNSDQPVLITFGAEFSPEQFSENFGDAKYGVWKILRDKNVDSRSCIFFKASGFPEHESSVAFKRNDFACFEERKPGKFKNYKCSDYNVSFVFFGATANGFYYDNYGNKNIKYGNISFLYKSEKIPVNTCKDCNWDINSPCPVTGRKVDLKIEKSLAYKDAFALIKGEPGATAVLNNAAPNIKTTTTKTETKTNTAAEKPTPTSAASTALKPLDKKKPGYFVEKSGNEINREGYKNGEKLNGEVRVYTDGKIREVSFYVNDKKNGPSTYYFDTGQIEMSGNMKDDEKDGEWKFYNDNGKLRETRNYLNGENQD